MNVLITDIKLDKESYLYGIDKKINLTFKIKSNIEKNQIIKEVYIYYGFFIQCLEKKHNIYDNKILVKNNLKLAIGEEKLFSVSVPILIAKDKGHSTEIVNFLQIKLVKPNIKTELETNIQFLVKEYEKNDIKNVTNYSGLDSYVKSEVFENHSDRQIAYKLKEFSNLDDNYIDVEEEPKIIEEKIENISDLDHDNKIFFKNRFQGLFSSITYIQFIDKDLLVKLKKESLFIRFSYFLLNSEKYGIIYKYNLILLIIILVLFLIYSGKILGILTFFMLFLSMVIVLGSKIIEIIYDKKILQKVYSDIELHNLDDISKKLNKKLRRGTLSINDIFKNFSLKVDTPIDYNISVSMNSYLQSFNGPRDSIRQETDLLKGVELFNSKGHGVFNINDIKLLENNYSGLYNILIPVFEKGFFKKVNKIYYKIIIVFKTSYFPDYKKEIIINFDKKLIIKSKVLTYLLNIYSYLKEKLKNNDTDI